MDLTLTHLRQFADVPTGLCDIVSRHGLCRITRELVEAVEYRTKLDPQRATSGEENDANPGNGIPVEGPESLPVRIGRQVGGQKPDQPEGYDDPAVASR